MDTIKKNEILLKDRNCWLYFSEPLQVIIAPKLEDVPATLNEVERLVEERGWHAAGFLSYEAASAFDPVLPSRSINGFPYLWFGLYSRPQRVDLPKPSHPKVALNWQPIVDRKSYDAAIEKIRDYIADGRTYQVNYTLRLQTDFDSSAWEYFLHLAQTQNDHAAYVDIGRYTICSASPELFFELNGDTITSRPMKGTAWRGRTTREDRAQADWLKNSEKNRAENVMIVDMIRNDLGRIAKIGSVHVSELFTVERYPTLWQMTSTVTAETTASISRIFGALFPCASITGAPKVSTMKMIHELETTPRRIYTGSIGYISPARKAKLNVAIRTVLIDKHDQKAEYGVGGGIVWDSTSADEYGEVLLKTRVLIETSPQFSLFETMLWEPNSGFFLKRQHIERLLDSAFYFDFPVSKSMIEERLDQIEQSFTQPQRFRVLLDREGRIEIQFTTIAIEEKTIQARLAAKPIDSSDVFIFHKTTHREVYDTARAAHPDWDDILLHNERGELTEFTIGNLVVELEGELVTPPIECGLLPGTFRSHLVETGQVSEKILSIQQLKHCSKIYRVNSLRKWEPVQIEEYNR